jgi:hypothetical protein
LQVGTSPFAARSRQLVFDHSSVSHPSRHAHVSSSLQSAAGQASY